MAEERVRWHFQESSFFQGERERSRERNSRADSRGVKNSRGWGEVCPGYLTSAFRDLPMVVLTN